MTLKLSRAARRLRASRTIVFATGLLLAAAASLHAQDRNAVSVEASVGAGAGRGGGPFVLRSAFATDLSAAFRLNSAHENRLLVSVVRGWQDVSNPDLDCSPEPSGKCEPTFPTFTSLILLAGLETGQLPGGTVRFLVGPGYYRSENARVGGAEGRVEMATHAAAHFALVGFARGDVLGRVSGSTLRLWALGVGIRLE